MKGASHEKVQTRIVFFAGTWYIPGIGQVIVTAAGAVLVAGAVIEVGSWIYDTVVEWFATRAEIKEAKEKIPSNKKCETD